MRLIVLSFVLSVSLIAADSATISTPPATNPLRNAYFDDLHVHTSFSLDAYIMGNRNDPRAAYRYGRGEPITLTGGQRRQLATPLDFMAVTDHDIPPVRTSSAYRLLRCEPRAVRHSRRCSTSPAPMGFTPIRKRGSVPRTAPK